MSISIRQSLTVNNLKSSLDKTFSGRKQDIVTRSMEIDTSDLQGRQQQNLSEVEILAFKEAWFEQDRLFLKKENSNVQLISKLLLKQDQQQRPGFSIVEFVAKQRAEQLADLQSQERFLSQLNNHTTMTNIKPRTHSDLLERNFKDQFSGSLEFTRSKIEEENAMNLNLNIPVSALSGAINEEADYRAESSSNYDTIKREINHLRKVSGISQVESISEYTNSGQLKITENKVKRRYIPASKQPIKRTRTFQPKASIHIAASLEKFSKDSLQVSKGIEEEELSELVSVRFNPVTVVFKADGLRVDSSLRKAGIETNSKGKNVEFYIQEQFDGATLSFQEEESFESPKSEDQPFQ